MVKQATVAHVKDAKSSVIFPVYEEGHFCSKLVDALGYDFNEGLDKSYGKITIINTMGKLDYPTIYVLGLGKQDELCDTKLLNAFGKVVKAVKEDSVTFGLNQLQNDKFCIFKLARFATEAVLTASYSFTKINAEAKKELECEIVAEEDVTKEIEMATIIAEAINHTRTLGNMPSNLMTPEDLAEYAEKLAKECNLEATILTNKELKEIGAGALLGVNQGSAHEARLIVLKYNGAKDEPYTALVGKGLTFDSGGYNLKPSASMTGMKFDMCGGATVLGAMEIIAKKKLNANVYCIVPSTENMISGEGYKCDDVLVSLSGKTIEITNTDAEGRLILCDAITYAQNEGATRIIDVATLTGACVVALGGTYTGAFSNCDKFFDEISASAKATNEKLWRLPLDDDYAMSLKKCEVADLVNSGGRMGGASVAAEFLHQFVEEGTSWIHLDVAGTASGTSEYDLGPIGATGAMVKTIANLFE